MPVRSRKRAVSLPPALDEQLEHHVSASRDGNVSAFVAEAVQEKLDRERDLGRLHDLWGDLDPDLLALARERILGTPPASPRTLPTA